MAVRRNGFIVLSMVLATTLASCDDSPVEGDRDMVTETRVVEEFNALQVDSGAEVFLTVDPAVSGEVDLAVTTDSNLLEFVTTEVSGETLQVSIDSNGEVNSTEGFEIVGTAGALVDVEASNGGEATITASVSMITLKAVNAGRIDGESLEAQTVELEADNGATITVCVTGTVTGSVTNGADVTVLCGANVSAVETSNGGTISSG